MQRGVARFGVLIGVVLALVCAVSAPAASTHDRMVIKIGALVDDGAPPATSPLFKKAVELAALQMNEALKHRGARVEFEVIHGDTNSAGPTARALAIQMINEQGVVGLLAASSGEAVAVNRLNYDPASPVVNKVPVTCFMCSNGNINNPAFVDAVDPVNQATYRDVENWLFRAFYNGNYEAAALTQITIAAAGGDRNGDGVFKVGILSDAGHMALALAIGPKIPVFYSGASTTQIKSMTAPATLDTLTADWATVVAGNPDVVMMTMMPAQAYEGLKAYRLAGYTIPIVSNNSFRREYTLAALEAFQPGIANGLEGSSVMLVDSSVSGELFYNAFKAYTGQGPELTASGAYDGTVALMLAALTAAGDLHRPSVVTPAAVRQGLTEINNLDALKIRPSVHDYSKAAQLIRHGWPINFEGAYNPEDWNAVGDIFPPLVHWKVENGQFVEYEQYQCNPQHPNCQ